MNSTLKAVAAALSLAATSAFAVVDGKIHSFSASPNPAAVGQPVSMIATINFEDIKPKGTTAYYDGGTVIPGCEALPYDSSGNAQRCVHAFDTAGTHHLTATYSGDTTYPSSSATQDLVVQEGKWTPTFDIFNSDDPDGNAVIRYLTLRVVEPNVNQVDTSAGGTATFFDGVVQLRDCTDVPVVSGVAQCHEPFSAGNHTITAQYSGDAKYNPGTTSFPTQAFSPGRKAYIDFDGDNFGDLLLVNDRDNSAQFWLMNGSSVKSMITVAGPSNTPSTWKAGDFDGDGHTDLLRQDGDGSVLLYRINSGVISSITSIRAAGSGARVSFVADFNNDGRADILWRNADGSADIWLMSGSSAIQQATIMPAGSWRAAKIGDFDGDGRADIVWVNDADGSVGLWIMDGTTRLDRTTLMGPGTGWTPAFVADLANDGKSDIVWTHADGSVGLWQMQGTQRTARLSLMGPGTGWAPVLVSDRNNQVFWRHADGTLGVWTLGTNTGGSCCRSDGPPTVGSKMTVLPAGSPWNITAVQDVDNNPTLDGNSGDWLFSTAGGGLGLWRVIGAYVVDRTNLLPDGSWRLINTEALAMPR